MNRLTVAGVAAVMTLAPATVAVGQVASEVVAERPNQVIGNELTPAQRQAVERGLEFLASRQQRDGSYGGHGSSSNPGITALAGLAFMSAGNMPGRGKYGENVQRALDYILSQCRPDGLIASDNSHGSMYGHGFATLFLGEIYGMTQDDEVKEKLQRAVRLLQSTQNSEGGWRYQPRPLDADISVTITAIMGLRAAHDAGIHVDPDVIQLAIQYVRRCQNRDGGFSYIAGQGSGSAFPRSAAGVASLYYAGIFDDDGVTRGLDYLKNAITGRGGRGAEAGGFFFYGHYYAAQAMFLAGGEYWELYYPYIRDLLVSRQNRSTGAWSGDVSEDYSTAMALIILQMPNRYLPVFHGKGPGS